MNSNQTSSAPFSDYPDEDIAEQDHYGYDDEPDLDFGFEHDSAMESIGWGTDEDYGCLDNGGYDDYGYDDGGW